jgi:uncharacterized paraquat-inducible protein A
MRTCKKCGKPLPDDYKKKLCESCTGKKAETVKNSLKTVLSVAVVVGGTIVTLATNGKINPTKK